jgi:integrase
MARTVPMSEIRRRERNGRVSYLARHYVDGRKVSKSFDRQKDAKDWLTTIGNSKLTGTYVDPNRSKVTVGRWAQQWIDSKVNLAPKTKDRYEQIIRAHIEPRWGKVRLCDVAHADLQDWIAGINAAPATVRKVHGVMSLVLAYAVKDGRLAVNAAAGVSLPRVHPPEKRFLTHEQVHDLADACGDEYRLVVLFLAYTGLRWGEMAALRVSRLDFLRRRAHVKESVTPIKGVMTFGDTKGHEDRKVPLPPFLLEDLARQVEGKAPGDLVFVGERGGVMRSQTFQRAVLTRAVAELGIPGFHPHELRHTAASLAIASGADIKIVQQMLGHKKATMTLDQYGHLYGDRLDVVADAMDAARVKALSDRHQTGTLREPGEVVELGNRR